MKTKRFYFAVLTLLLFFSLQSVLLRPVSAAVTLEYFKILSFSSNAITLEWSTATEINNLGFYIHRAESASGSYAIISDFIPAEGTAVSGSLYQFTDSTVQSGGGYYYRLEAVDFNNSSEFFGPVTNVTPTPSSTPTRTSTILAITGTTTATRAPAVTATITFTPTETSPFSFVTNTPTQTSTVTPLNSPTSKPTETEESTQTPIPTKFEVKTSTPNPALFTPTPLPPASSTLSKGMALRALMFGFFGMLALGSAGILVLYFYSKKRGQSI